MANLTMAARRLRAQKSARRTVKDIAAALRFNHSPIVIGELSPAETRALIEAALIAQSAIARVHPLS